MKNASPPTPTLPVDPNLAPMAAQADRDQINALQIRSQMDTGSLMARYGARIALGLGQAPSSTSPKPIQPLGFG